MGNFPIGISIELALNDNYMPSLLIYKQRMGRLRARCINFGNLFTDVSVFDFSKIGLKIDFNFGRWKRPVGRKPWNTNNHIFVFDSFIPLLGFFISFNYNKYGQPIYFGVKSYQVQPDHITWAKESEVGKIYLCPSMNI